MPTIFFLIKFKVLTKEQLCIGIRYGALEVLKNFGKNTIEDLIHTRTTGHIVMLNHLFM